MNTLHFTSEIIRFDGYVKRTIFLVGDITAHEAFNLKNNIPEWFQEPLDEIEFSLEQASDLDIIGVSALVRFKMIALKKNIPFRVLVPYKKNMVDFLNKTKLTDALNVQFVFAKNQKLAKAA